MRRSNWRNKAGKNHSIHRLHLSFAWPVGRLSRFRFAKTDLYLCVAINSLIKFIICVKSLIDNNMALLTS